MACRFQGQAGCWCQRVCGAEAAVLGPGSTVGHPLWWGLPVCTDRGQENWHICDPGCPTSVQEQMHPKKASPAQKKIQCVYV